MTAKYPREERCSECGEMFVRKSTHDPRKCRNCINRRKRVRKNYMTANTKPASMSEVRWRIELRRRQNPAYYAMCGDVI